MRGLSEGPVPDPEVALTELLLSLFSSSELRRLVRYSFGAQGRAIEMSLPGAQSSPMATAQGVVAELVRRGLANPELFRRLREERPYRSREIDQVEQDWSLTDAGRAQVAPLPAPPHTASPPATEGTESQTTPPTRPARLFISYSREDQEWAVQLRKHLRVLVWTGVLEVWDDTRLEVGTEWEQTILANLNSADIIVLLVSANFFGSEYCWKNEVPVAVRRGKEKSALVVPIIVEQCAWDKSPFKDFMILPDPKDPIAKWADRNEAWTKVVRAIGDSLKRIPR